ncbi:MAG: hypothetical protein IKN25_00465 [Spirochaetales bacterium]|nr:hypothetical protein [Spirochaetales bacterium]
MDFKYASVIKIFQTIRDFKPDNDPSLSIDALLDSPAALITDYSLHLYDDEIAAAVVHADTHKVIRSYDDDYSDEDFIDPNALKEAELSEDVLSEIELKFDDITDTLQTILSSMDLRLYADNRPDLKKAIYKDLFNKYFSEYKYLTRDILTRLSSMISNAVDKAMRSLSAPLNERAAELFGQILLSAGQYIDTNIAKSANKSDKFAQSLYMSVRRLYIDPARQTYHYSFEEYRAVCRMMNRYIKSINA